MRPHILTWPIVIQLQRLVDQTRRILTGVPSARRSEITPYMYVGGQFFEKGLHLLKQWGITGVINMRIERAPGAFSKVPWLETLHLPTVDHHPPSISDLQKGVEFIQSHRDRQGKVYIHCRAGEGRAPSMAIAYLISQGLIYDDAMLLVKSARPFISLHKGQVQRLKEWEQLFTRK